MRRQMLVLSAVLAVLALSCGGNGSSSGAGVGPSGSGTVLTVHVDGNINGQTVAVNDPLYGVTVTAYAGAQASASSGLDGTGTARITGIANGTYQVLAASTFGFDTRGPMVDVSSSKEISITIPAKYAVKFLSVDDCKGNPIPEGSTLKSPAALCFNLQVMNQESNSISASVDVIGNDGGSKGTTGVAFTGQTILPGLQKAVAKQPGFVPCTLAGPPNWEITRCVTQTTSLSIMLYKNSPLPNSGGTGVLNGYMLVPYILNWQL